MIENGKQILLLILSVILISFIAYKCDTNKNILPKESITKIEYKRDTLILYDTITITKTKSIINIIENKTYDTIHMNNYFNQTFKDTNYLLNTYGGFVDSIKLDLYTKEIHITDSIIKTITNNIYINSKGLYIGGDINVLEKNLLVPEFTIGYQFKNQIIINGGIGIFNKQPFYNFGFKVKI